MVEAETHKNMYDDLHFDELEPRDEMTPEVAKEFFPVHREPPIETMDEPVIIETAYPGWQAGGDHYPAVPSNPDETVEELVDSVEAGAVGIHVHPRDRRGIPQLADEDLFTDVIDRVFEACCKVITFSHTWRPASDESLHADYVTTTRDLLDRGNGNKYCQGSLILPIDQQGSAYHSRSSIVEGVRFFEANDVKPLFRLYDSHVIKDLQRHVFEPGEATWDPFILNVNAGKHHAHAIHKDPWSYLQVISAMNTVEETIDDGIVNLYPGGRNWLPNLVLGLISGATVFRVGIEDTYWMYPHRDEVIQKNSEQVELAVNLAEKLGREVITDPDRAREHLGMKYTSPR